MAGRTPLNNAKFINSPDFNSYGITGATGGSFHTYTAATGGSNYTLGTSDVGKMIQLTGNSVVEIPNTITASPGDEILVYSPTGTVKITPLSGVTLADTNYTVSPPARPARLINTATNAWRVAGYKFSYFPFSAVDCCGSSVPTMYQFNSDFSVNSTTYADAAGQTLYSPADPYLVYNSVDYTVINGVAAVSTCPVVDFNTQYTVWDSGGSPVDLYTWGGISILSPAIFLYRWKTSPVLGVYPCSADYYDANGTYYRTYTDFVLGDPICIVNGVVVAETACP